MPVSRDMIRAWVRPGAVMRERLAEPVREDRAFLFLLAACGLVFVAQWPRLARQAYLEGEALEPLMGAALMAWVFIAPLLFYGLAALSHLVARLAGGRGSWYGARLALFWSLLCVAPVWLLHGLTAGFIGPSAALTGVGLALLGLFLWIWIASLAVAERGMEAA
ncbi:YIP1 family protein [Jannaschia sp. W003]|uniref:YIP1 family protein n=1 Tax=Jannaschia sp. W003 TaxID=2867012 RepID=UPI0021A55AF4|nr:YIP1 family protein [Jannaschia sp. W003]UWQ20600.1 YIP1 family protein [Jannaschia sp. W003]